MCFTGTAEQGGGVARAPLPPPIFLELEIVSKQRCLVPPPPPPQSQSCSAVPVLGLVY